MSALNSTTDVTTEVTPLDEMNLAALEDMGRRLMRLSDAIRKVGPRTDVATAMCRAIYGNNGLSQAGTILNSFRNDKPHA